tara:strand:- start:99 stop:1094 length:996 start_codon:yes stop_codon:yes gene_type:complete
MNSKSKLGQFYTTNSDYILQGMKVPDGVDVIEPFCGQGDLVKWVGKKVEKYDIDPKIDAITQDTLLNPPDYRNKYVITNPPYLARNKNSDKTLYDKYDMNDLYKIAVRTIIDGDALGGILIIPLNFISEDSHKLRELFFSKYRITRLNIFEEDVFDDTSYTVCSFQFEKHDLYPLIPPYTKINTFIYPTKENIELTLDSSNRFTIGKALFPNIKSEYNVRRLVAGNKPTTNLYLRAIDTGTDDGRISLSINENHLYGSLTDRTFCTIQTDKKIKDEQMVCDDFNRLLEKLRKEYNSLFLTNYRNSTSSYARKRISFKQAYSLIEQILSERS